MIRKLARYLLWLIALILAFVWYVANHPDEQSQEHYNVPSRWHKLEA